MAQATIVVFALAYRLAGCHAPHNLTLISHKKFYYREPDNTMAFLNGTKLPPAVLTEHSAMSPPPRPFPSRARSTSHATAVRSLKRLSLSFPAQLEPEQGQKTHTISSSSSSTFLLPSTPSSYSERIAVPTDSNNFLTTLATQERRVLEMKEELQKAEIDLDKLKKQWALHEGTRKRDEIRNIGRLEPLKGAFDRSALFESHTDVARKGKELERRKAMYAGTRQPQRKVFSGSRHTRALSILTPNTCTYERPSRAEKALQPDEISSIDPKLGRSSTVPASMGSTAASANGSARVSTSRGVGPPKDAILQTGKQIVGDFKEGLLTFIEDLRQATAGDEAVHGAVHRPEDRAPRSFTNRKTARKSTAQTDLRLRNIALPKPPNVAVDVPRAHPKDRRDGGESSLMELNRGYWELNGVKFMPTATCGSNLRDENKDDTSVDDEDGWENWDSPTARSISPYRWRDRTHASGEINSSSTVSSSPRTSMSSTNSTPRPVRSSPSKVNEIPWPALTKLSPRNLRKTASTLVSEWEKGLTPPASEGSRDLIDFRVSSPLEEQTAG